MPPAPWLLPGAEGLRSRSGGCGTGRRSLQESWGHSSALQRTTPAGTLRFPSGHSTTLGKLRSPGTHHSFWGSESPASFLLLRGPQNPRRCSDVYREQPRSQVARVPSGEESLHTGGEGSYRPWAQALGERGSSSQPPTIRPPTVVGVGVELAPRAQLTGTHHRGDSQEPRAPRAEPEPGP